MPEADGIGTAVVSMPCWEVFEEQPASYRANALGRDTVRVEIEAAVRLGWDRWIGEDGAFVGVSSVGASGAVDDLWRHFCFMPEAVADTARNVLAGRQGSSGSGQAG